MFINWMLSQSQIHLNGRSCSLVVIISMETNLTDGIMVGCYDTPDMWWVITSYFVSPGSVMARKRERERKGEYSISIWNANFAQVLERFVLLQMLPFSFLKPWTKSKHKFVSPEKELHKHQSEGITENFWKMIMEPWHSRRPACLLWWLVKARERGIILYQSEILQKSPGKICSPPDAPLLCSETLDGIQA